MNFNLALGTWARYRATQQIPIKDADAHKNKQPHSNRLKVGPVTLPNKNNIQPMVTLQK